MTEIDWLIEKLKTQEGIDFIPSSLIKQAKEIEKQQKEYFFECGRQYQLTGEGTFTEVYDETFKK